MNLFLLLTSGKHKGLPIPVRGDLLMIGSDPVCQVQSRLPQMGRQHCAIVTRQGKFFVRDLNSGEQTILNQATVPASQEWPLHVKDRLTVGPHEFVIQFQELGLSQKDMEEWALKTLDVNAESGEPTIRNADEIQALLSSRYYNTAQKASNILGGLDPDRGIIHGRLRVNVEESVTTVRFNDPFLVEEAEIALVKQELYEFLAPHNLRVLLDFRNVAKMSSAAATMVLELYHWLRDRHSLLAVCRIKPELRSIFYMLDIKDVRHFIDKKQALESDWDPARSMGDGSAGFSLTAESLHLPGAQAEVTFEDDPADADLPSAAANNSHSASVNSVVSENRHEGQQVATNRSSSSFESPRASALMAATFELPSETGPEGHKLPEAIRLAIARFGPHVNFDLDADDPTQARGLESRLVIGAANLLQSLDTIVPLSPEAALHRSGLRKSMRGKRISKRRTIALQEKGQFVIYCPNGHLIIVHERHRGRIGHCPDCKEPFLVPPAPMQEISGTTGSEISGGAGVEAAAANGQIAAAARDPVWVRDVHFHRVNPEKLKLTSGSLQPDYDTADLGFFSAQLVVAIVYSGRSPVRQFLEPGAKTAKRKLLLDHLAEKKPLAELKSPAHFELTREQLAGLKVVQPTPPGEESPFINVPVFGGYAIAVRLPIADTGRDKCYLSFLLSGFREFCSQMAEFYDIGNLGENLGVPLSDNFSDHKCHYSSASFQSLADVDYYRADPIYKLIVTGHQCAGCGLIVSEDSRKKEKIGGKTEKSIATAKCPKCKKPFGNKTFYSLKTG